MPFRVVPFSLMAFPKERKRIQAAIAINGLVRSSTSPISTAGTPAALRSRSRLRRMLRGDCDQQSAGGLRIEQDRLQLLGNSFVVADHAFGEIAVVFQAAGNVAGANAIQRAFEQRESG